jgi:hypothetical protein
MSIWTHVAGVIRFDAMRFADPEPPWLGSMYRDDAPLAQRVDLPCGSEGSLQWILWTNPHKSHLAAYTATIFGDLRDYDRNAEIVAYFNRVATVNAAQGKFIRQACFECHVEGHAAQIYQYDSETNQFKLFPYMAT